MTYIPSILYTVNYYDHAGNLFVPLHRWERVEFTLRQDDPWNAAIYLYLSPTEELGNTLREMTRDFFLVIERTDYITSERTVVYEGFHNTVSEQMMANGNIYMSLYSGGYTTLLERRLVLPITTEVFKEEYLTTNKPSMEYNTAGAIQPGMQNERTGFAESVIKAYVYDCMLDQLYPDRIMPGLHIAADQGRGEIVDYKARYVQLDSVLKNLIERSHLHYGIDRYQELGTFLFDCRPIWGLDKTVDNAEGNPPVVFSNEHGNMFIPILSRNHRHEKNFVYVGGDGEGENRKIIAVSDGLAIAESPWSRSEYFASNAGDNSETALKDIGRSALKEKGTERGFYFDVIQTPSCRWPLDWNLGDIVTAYYQGYRFDRVVDGITVNVSPNTARIETLSLELKIVED